MHQTEMDTRYGFQHRRRRWGQSWWQAAQADGSQLVYAGRAQGQRETRWAFDFAAYLLSSLTATFAEDGINVMTREPLPIIDEEPAMILGIDATHPPPGSHSLSIASVVASVNRTCTLYRATTAILPNRAETVEKLGNITYDYIRLFQMYNNRALPQKIIAYRDGVSEGQFETILGSEVAQIKTAAKRISTERVKMGRTPYDPKVTFVVTQKRHHSRWVG